MSPVVFRAGNLKFSIYFHDHSPPHVHVIGKGVEAVFNIQTLECTENFGFSARTILKIRIYLSGKREQLMEKWNEYQEKED